MQRASRVCAWASSFSHIYINDLPNVSKFLSFYLFADDTNIYFDASDTIKLNKIMSRELRHVKKWLEKDKLALNIEKNNNHAIFHSPVKKITEPIIIKFGRKHIPRSDNEKFFGVLLDETVSWRSHLIELYGKLARSVGIFYKLIHFVPS